MIALLAAVTAETTLIRQAVTGAERKWSSGLELLHGELHGARICLAHGGIGKAAAAAATITLLNKCRPEALWVFGCGGAYPGAGLQIGDLALAREEIFGDEGVVDARGFHDLRELGYAMRRDGDERLFNTWPVDAGLHDWAWPLLKQHAGNHNRKARSGRFVTVSSCTGVTTKALELERRTGGICENMEGAAVALACRQMAVPLLEIRGISNLVEDRDTNRWDLAAGMTAAQQAVLALLESWSGRPA